MSEDRQFITLCELLGITTKKANEMFLTVQEMKDILKVIDLIN